MINTTNSLEQYNSHYPITVPKNNRIVLVGGCFDILHFGHIQFLQKAKDAGDYLIVALEPDERIIQDKKRIPAHPQHERAQNVLALRSVDKVVLLPLLQGFDDYKKLVHNIKPHVIAVTKDDPFLENKKIQAQSVDAQCVIVTERIDPFSTTMIYQQLKNY